MLALAGLSLLIWAYLLAFRGKYWLEKPQPFPEKPPLTTPDVAIVVPARNEAAVIERSIRSLFRQDYTGPFKIFLVDDHSTDKTAELARLVSESQYQMARLVIVPSADLPQGWGGKVWAMQQGLSAVAAHMPQAEYVLFTDADIEHSKDSLRELVARAESEKLALASFMVRLNCTNIWEKFLIPAFVYFFMMLYPFAQVRDAKSKVAAAAGGAMLARMRALKAINGFQDMKGALIDDCTLAKKLKKEGPIWLGLARETQSIRPYQTLDEIWGMIARSAYNQLGYSPFMLFGCILGMAAVFIAPAVVMACGTGLAQIVGLSGYLAMTVSYLPIMRVYRQNAALALSLPFAAFIYLLATLDSAYLHYTGRGGMWKGRAKSTTKQ